MSIGPLRQDTFAGTPIAKPNPYTEAPILSWLQTNNLGVWGFVVNPLGWTNVLDIVADSTYFYVSCIVSGSPVIARCKRDLSAANVIYTAAAGDQPCAMSIVGSKLYFTVFTTNSPTTHGGIYVMNVDGSNVQQLLTGTQAGLVLNSTGIHADSTNIFWPNQNGNPNGPSRWVAKATIAGALSSLTFIDTFGNATGICGDSTHLYLCDTTNNVINQALKSTGAGGNIATAQNNPRGIDTDGTWAYWVNLGTSTINRCLTPNGGSVGQFMNIVNPGGPLHAVPPL